jgi:type I restriction enzyme, S subunit
MKIDHLELAKIIAPAKLIRARNGKLPVLSMTMRDGLIDQVNKFKKRVASADTSQYKVVRKNQLVVGFPIDEGVLAFQNRYDEAIVSPAYDVWDLQNPSQVSSNYLERFLRSPFALAFYATKLRGTTARRRTLPDDIFLSLRVPLPQLAEQRRIAEVLHRAEALRAKRRLTLTHLDSVIQSVFVDLFGDPATNPKGWPIKPLGSLATKFSDGPFGSNLKTEHYTSSGVRVVRLQNIGIGEFIDDDAAYISEGHFARLKKHECLPGDVLVGTLGDPNLRACMQPAFLTVALNKADCVQIRVDKKCATANFVCRLLNHPSTQWLAQDLMHGQTRVRISMGRLRKLNLPVPPVTLQREFARRVAVVEKLKSAQRASLSEMDALFASLQHRAFQGQL